MQYLAILSLCVAFWGAVAPCGAAGAQDYYQAGVQLYQKGQYGQADQYLEAAAQLDPGSWQAYQVLSESYYQEGRKDKALEAADRSLRIHPDNPPLRVFADGLGPGSPSAAATPAAGPEKPQPPRVNPALANSRFYVRDSLGIGYVPFWGMTHALQQNLDDFTAADPNNAGQVYGVNGIFSFNNELGYCLDDHNAVAFSVDFSSGGADLTEETSSVSGADEIDNRAQFKPSIVGYDLDYVYSLPDGDGRWFAKVGVGFYQGAVDFTNIQYSSATEDESFINYHFSGSTIGGMLEFGREFILFGAFGMDLSLQAVYADVGKLTAPYDTGSKTLAMAVQSDGALELVDDSQVGKNGIKYATLDFLQFTPHLSFTLHL